MSASRSGSSAIPSMPWAMMSLMAQVAPWSSVVTIAFQARLLWRYWSIDMAASWRRKSASRKGFPFQAPLRERASEIADARPLLRPRPGQKWMALAASPSRKPYVPGELAVEGSNSAVKRGRCTMSRRKEVTALRSSSSTPNRRSPSCTRFHSAEPLIRAGRNRVLWVEHWKSPCSSRPITHGREAMHSSKTRRTGSMPTTSAVSASVRRMLRKPSPRSELSRNRFCATVSSTAMGSVRPDFTRRPSTTSCRWRPSTE